MEIKKPDTNLEKQIVTSMIVSDKYLKHISDIIDINLLKLNYSRIIANMCLQYYKKYKSAPHQNIQTLFEEYKTITTDQELVKLVEIFLEHLNDNYVREEKFNEQFALDLSIKYLKQRKLQDLKQKIEDLSKNGQEDEAEKLVSEYKKVQLPVHTYTDVFNDTKIIDQVLNWEEEELFRFSGDFGRAIGSICRGDLVAFASPAKRGKTWMLIESAIQTTIKSLRVVFFSFEMSKEKMLVRIYSNILGESRNEKSNIVFPFFKINDYERFEVVEKKIERDGLNSKKVREKLKNIKPMLKGGNLKLFCSSPHGTSLSDIKTLLDSLLSNEGFAADIVIVDYADITKNDYKTDQHRHKLNNIWEQLRALALEKFCAVITATHTNKNTFDKDMRQGDISEDIRKINHVTKMIGINQTKEEKSKGIVRFVVLANREDDFNISNEVIALQCLSIGKPILDSKLDKDCEKYYIKEKKEK